MRCAVAAGGRRRGAEGGRRKAEGGRRKAEGRRRVRRVSDLASRRSAACPHATLRCSRASYARFPRALRA
ncbi:hypothetical protein C6T63_08615 [Burkholderia multivorans]|nr:hypothetical protein C6T63_08615 [Burkholderia multivorans]